MFDSATRSIRQLAVLVCAATIFSTGVCPAAQLRRETAVFIEDGLPKAVEAVGKPFILGDGFLESSETGNFIVAKPTLGPGDFQVTAELTILNLAKSAASFVLGGKDHFGFEGGTGRMFMEGPRFDNQMNSVDALEPRVQEGKPFKFEVTRTGSALTFSIDGEKIHKIDDFTTDAVGEIAFRPWRSTMRIHRFAATGRFLPSRTQPEEYTIPTIDLSHDKSRQVIVERLPGQYLGHPTTVLMPDGKTIYCTYPLGHGGPAAVLKKSIDGGLTWSDRLPVPENWQTATNCPCIHRLTAPDGRERLFVFEGNGPMRQSHSEDGGKTWTPFEPNGLHCVVAPITIVPIQGNRLLGMYHRGKEDRDRPPLGLWQSISADGGMTWQEETLVAEYPGGNPCEPFVVRSPDGKQLAALARENARRYNSLLVTSDDEGRTWSKPVELPAALTGDRHMGRYAPDGRLVICFRDTTHQSPTRGDFVA